MALSAFSFLLNPKALIRTGLMIVAAILALKIWNFVEDSIEAQQRVIQQEVVIQLKDQEINTLNATIEQMQEAVRIAEEAEREIEALEDELERIAREAAGAGDEDDGPLAPVLRDTLCALRPDCVRDTSP